MAAEDTLEDARSEDELEDEREGEIPEGAEGNGTQNEGNEPDWRIRFRRIRAMLRIMAASRENREGLEKRGRSNVNGGRRSWRN